MCARCPTEQVADAARTACVCPRGYYNASQFEGGQTIQCLADHHLGAIESSHTSETCVSCGGSPCVECGEDGWAVKAGWSSSGSEDTPSSTPWFVFHCVDERACLNSDLRKCRAGHIGQLCNLCDEVLRFPVINTCGHVYCSACIERYRKPGDGGSSGGGGGGGGGESLRKV